MKAVKTLVIMTVKNKKTRRILLWVLGWPLAIVAAVAAMGGATYCVAPEATMNATIKVMSVITPLQETLQDNTGLQKIDQQMKQFAAYTREEQSRAAEICLKKAVASCTGKDAEMGLYITAANNLAKILRDKGDYKGALKTLTTAIDMTALQHRKLYLADDAIANLYMGMGYNLAVLGQASEAEEHFGQAFKAYVDNKTAYSAKAYVAEQDTGYYRMTAEVTATATEAFIFAGRYDKAAEWMKREEQNLQRSRQLGDSLSEGKDEYLFRYYLRRAKIMQHNGDDKAASEAYDLSAGTAFARTQRGLIVRGDYLTEAGQWREALRLYEQVDSYINDSGQASAIGNISGLLIPKYRALRGTGQTARAIELADSISRTLGNALQKAKNDDAAELATIYETQQQEAEAAEREAKLNHRRVWGLIFTLVSLCVFFVAYTMVRRRVMKMKAEHDRLENELHIARDIQMSMVPSVFPDYEGLDMYASMTPAKEVGGDLYGYVLQGDKLYFAVGDVSGKGVPASLFMAQATRLFRTLATQGMMPAEICTRMNTALTEDNEQGMFVTLFLGLIDLKTGHTDFCNAGHNPPVVDGHFLEMETNAPIGLWPELEFVGEEIEDIKGHPLFIYTDGLNEAENTAQEQFGDEHLLEILRQTKAGDARQIVEAMAAEVEKHRNGAPTNDDLTMMFIEMRNMR